MKEKQIFKKEKKVIKEMKDIVRGVPCYRCHRDRTGRCSLLGQRRGSHLVVHTRVVQG